MMESRKPRSLLKRLKGLLASIAEAPERPAAKAEKLAALVAEDLNAQRSRLAQGLTINLDYPVKPRVRTWTAEKRNDFCRRIVANGEDRYRAALEAIVEMRPFFASISASEPADEREPWWLNPWFPTLDAISLTFLLRRLNPRRYLEIGSGNSTKFARRAIDGFGLRTKVISIDPYPRAEIDTICDKIIRSPLEECDLAMFDEISAEDVVFVDNSHRSFQNSDVTVFFTELLPTLKPGCVYGLHDIFLPDDYPAEWSGRYYNEQYLLMSYLLGGAAGDEIVLPMRYVQVTSALAAILDPIVMMPALGGAPAIGGAFWMRKRARAHAAATLSEAALDQVDKAAGQSQS